MVEQLAHNESVLSSSLGRPTVFYSFNTECWTQRLALYFDTLITRLHMPNTYQHTNTGSWVAASSSGHRHAHETNLDVQTPTVPLADQVMVYNAHHQWVGSMSISDAQRYVQQNQGAYYL